MSIKVDSNEDKGKAKGDAWSRTKKVAGGALGYGFIGVDATMRIKDGENPVAAIGKAALTNAAWNLVPGGFAAMLAIGAASAIPDVLNQLKEPKSRLNATKGMWNSNFEETQASTAMLDMDMTSMDNSRKEVSRAMSGYARKNNNRVY